LNFGEKVKYVRELRGFSQTDLAKMAGLSAPFISQIENGKKRPATEALEKLAKALNTNTWFFMDDNALSFEEMIKISDYEPPEDIVEFFATRESLPYAILARELHDEQIDPIFLRDLLETIKKMKSK